MLSQLAAGCEALRAGFDFTYEWFLSRVRPKMGRQIMTSESLITSGTFEWFLPRVRPNVDCQGTGTGEIALTCLAFVGLFSGMGAHVKRQIRGLNEVFVTDFTDVRFYSRVSPTKKKHAHK